MNRSKRSGRTSTCSGWLLNEAEAAAWQTRYPHLFFPTLATEKVQAVIAWDTKRQALQRARRAFWTADPAKKQKPSCNPELKNETDD